MPRRLKFWAKATFSLALLVWIVSSANLREVAAALADANLKWLALATCLPLIGIAIVAIRWSGLLRAQRVRIPMMTLIKSCIVAKFFGQFLPSTIAGDAIRAYDSWREGAKKSTAITVLVVDRLVGLVVLVLFGAVAVCFPQELTHRFPVLYIWVAIGAIGLSTCLWFVLAPSTRLISIAQGLTYIFPNRVRLIVERILTAMTIYRGQSSALAQALLLSVLLQLNVVTYYYCIGRAFELDLNYGLYYLIVPIAVFVMLAPVSINGIGVRESIFVFLLGTYGVDNAHAVAFAWLEHGILILSGGLGAIVYALRRASKAESLDASDAARQMNSSESMEGDPRCVAPPHRI